MPPKELKPVQRESAERNGMYVAFHCMEKAMEATAEAKLSASLAAYFGFSLAAGSRTVRLAARGARSACHGRTGRALRSAAALPRVATLLSSAHTWSQKLAACGAHSAYARGRSSTTITVHAAARAGHGSRAHTADRSHVSPCVG